MGNVLTRLLIFVIMVSFGAAWTLPKPIRATKQLVRKSFEHMSLWSGSLVDAGLES